MAMPIHRADLEGLDVSGVWPSCLVFATYEGVAGSTVQGPWCFVLTSCARQRHNNDHPKAADSRQNVAGDSLRATRRDAEVEEEHGCFRDCVCTQADYRNGVHVLFER